MRRNLPYELIVLVWQGFRTQPTINSILCVELDKVTILLREVIEYNALCKVNFFYGIAKNIEKHIGYKFLQHTTFICVFLNVLYYMQFKVIACQMSIKGNLQ